MTYMCLIIQEAHKSGGEVWHSNDANFRQNAATDPSADWLRLDASLHSATFLAFESEGGLFCHLCYNSDHMASDCALFPLLADQLPALPSAASVSCLHHSARKPLQVASPSGSKQTNLCVLEQRGLHQRFWMYVLPYYFRHMV